jgi:hypothetical protein
MLHTYLTTVKAGETMKPFQRGIWICSLLAIALTASVAVAADLPPLPQGLSAPAKATTMPAFNLPTAAGGHVRADEFKGKVVIARFWATW